MNRMQAAEQMRRVLQMFAVTLTDEKAAEVAAVFSPWETGKKYAAGDLFTYGKNGVGDPQLYRVIQAHTSQADWTPKAAASLYAPIGLDEEGYPIWSQPAGVHDAYQMGDVVNYQGVLYRSEVDGNVYSPATYAGVWTVYKENVG